MDGRQLPNSETQGFDVLVAPHLSRLFRLAYRLTGNAADAQDLVQDTCVAACEQRDAIAAADAPVAWLLRVLKNRFIDAGRRQRRAPFVAMVEADDPASPASDESGPEESLQQLQAIRQLELAFLSLEPLQRLVLGLRAEGHGLGDIESITGIPREVLRARLHRARRSLAQRLDEVRSAAPAAACSRSRA